jgi:hypothetical protein
MNVLSTGEEVTVWDLDDPKGFLAADNFWARGRVRVINRQVKFEAIIEGHVAWVAIDTIMKDEGDGDECELIPPKAIPATTPSPGTVTSLMQAPFFGLMSC